MKLKTAWFHKPTGVLRIIEGAKITSTETKVFATRTFDNAREKLFIADPSHWDVPLVELQAMFLSLEANEARRVRNKKARMKKEAAVSDEDRESWGDSRVLTPLLEQVEVEADIPSEEIEESEFVAVEAD